jgi:hypothetical protein
MTDTALGTIMLIEDEVADSLVIRRAFEKAGVENPVQTIAHGILPQEIWKASANIRIERSIPCRCSSFSISSCLA